MKNKTVEDRNQPYRSEKTVRDYLRENGLQILLMAVATIGLYITGIDRITTLEVKQEALFRSIQLQEKRAEKTDSVIKNNTNALNKIAVLFAKVDGKLDTFDLRIKHLEGNNERLARADIERKAFRTVE